MPSIGKTVLANGNDFLDTGRLIYRQVEAIPKVAFALLRFDIVICAAFVVASATHLPEEGVAFADDSIKLLHNIRRANGCPIAGIPAGNDIVTGVVVDIQILGLVPDVILTPCGVC